MLSPDEDLERRSGVERPEEMPDCRNCGDPYIHHITPWGDSMPCDVEKEPIGIDMGILNPNIRVPCDCAKYEA